MSSLTNMNWESGIWKLDISTHIIGIWGGIIIGVFIHASIWPINPCPNICIIDHVFERELIFGLSIGLFHGLAGIISNQKLGIRWILVSIVGWITAIMLHHFISDRILNGITSGLLLGIIQWTSIKGITKYSYIWIIMFGVLGIYIFQQDIIFTSINISIKYTLANYFQYTLMGTSIGIASGVYFLITRNLLASPN